MAANESLLQNPNRKQFILTIPKGLVLAKGWKKGDAIRFVINSKGDIELRR